MIEISASKPILIAGPTASGKSALALHIAQHQGGQIVNADSLQVYQGWPILTAQPSMKEQSLADHQLYAHKSYDAEYSVGHWIEDVKPLLRSQERPIIIGGTGLYFQALTKGLFPIPTVSEHIRHIANQTSHEDMLSQLSSQTIKVLDLNNPRRIQRAWEVFKQTGRHLHEWHQMPQTPQLYEHGCHCLCLNAPKEWLNERIDMRFEAMILAGALDEARAMKRKWDPQLSSSKAIGAQWMIDYLNGSLTYDQLKTKTTIATRQYAKRQRTWFRSKMSHWAQLDLSKRDVSQLLDFS